MEPLISTILPAYNGEHFLSQAVDSVLAQSLATDEFIVINNNSNDRTAEILKRYPEIKVLNQPILGQWHALNMGISQATGKYINFIDADDLWHKDKNKLQIEHLQDNPQIDMIFSFCQQFTENKSDNSQNFQLPQKGITQLCLTMERPKFIDLGLFKTELQAAAIYWFENAFSQGLKYDVLPETLAYRRVHESNRTRDEAYTKNLTVLAKQIIENKKLRQSK